MNKTKKISVKKVTEGKSIEDIRTELDKLRSELDSKRWKLLTGGKVVSADLKKIKKKIARLLTELNSR